MREWNCFVLMPFAEEFADVYLLLKDMKSAPDIPKTNIYRADDISEPGRITDQVLTAIRDCDFVIADVTRSNPNVMFELGYARALGRPAVIINQDVTQSPFDVAEMRQIVYDRGRLVGDLRPQVTAAVKAVLARLVRSIPQETPITNEAGDIVKAAHARDEAEAQAQKLESEILSADEAITKLEAIELETEMAGEDGESSRLRELAGEAKCTVDAVDASGASESDLRRLAGEVGDVAVTFHNASLYRDAEDLFNRALKIDDKHSGVHVQYALYWALHKKDFARAEELIRRAEQLGGDPSRIESARARLRIVRAHEGGPIDASLLEQVRERFEAHPNSWEDLGAYLLVLQRAERWDEIIRVCEMQLANSESDVSSEDGYRYRRVYADAIAVSNDRKHEQIAIRLYADILAHRPNDPQVLSNYATLLMRGDTQEQMTALACYLQAFQIMPEHSSLRRGFSVALRRLLGRKEIAARVLRGQRLTDQEAESVRLAIGTTRDAP